MDLYITKLQTISSTNVPFEEFGTKIAEIALFDLKKEADWDVFAVLIFNTDWSRYINTIKGENINFNDFINKKFQSEQNHILFMKLLAKELNFNHHQHDHSKGLFFILMCSFLGCPNISFNYRWLHTFIYNIVIRAHYIAERHHPEHEIYVKGAECTLDDVTETAIDRIARNYQFSNNGCGDLNKMSKFKPYWIKNSIRNADHYDTIVNRYYEEIGIKWRDFIKK